jgi:hypothetical protein
MVRRCIVRTLALSLLLCAVSSDAKAQITSRCITAIVWWGVTDGPITAYFPTAQCGAPGSGQGPFSGICWVFNYLCAPSHAAGETCPCAKGTASRPISLASGDTYIEENDV